MIDKFKHTIIEWKNILVPTKYPSNILGMINITKNYMIKVLIQNVEPDYNKEATENIVNILGGNHFRGNIGKVEYRDTCKNIKETKLLLGLLNEFENLFDVTLGTGNN